MKSTIVMQSDFGIDSGLVSCMHGIAKIVDPELEVQDITHTLPAFDIEAASYTLQYTVPCWPAGTVFVSVVDPGVGTGRRSCVAKLKNGSYVVTPDNGTLTYIDRMIGIEEVREIDETKNRYPLTRDIHVFHGRDIFAYCAARLASGLITFQQTGPSYPLCEIVRHEIKDAEVGEKMVMAHIKGYDPFGSAELSVTNEDFKKTGFKTGDRLDITIYDETRQVFHEIVPYEKSFGYVKKGKEVIFLDLASFVTIACNMDSFMKKYELDPETDYVVRIKEA